MKKKKYFEFNLNKLKPKNFGRKFENLAILLTICLLVFSVTIYYKGMHNVDLAHNYADLVDWLNNYNKENGLNQTVQIASYHDAMDIGNDFTARPLRDYYIHGLNQMEFGLTLGMFSAGLLGLLLGRKL